MTATKSWGPTLTESVGEEVDYQVAAPLKREHPTCTERISLTKECGWKDGDRGGLAEWEQTHGKKKAKVCLGQSTHGRHSLLVENPYGGPLLREPGLPAVHDLKSGRQLK